MKLDLSPLESAVSQLGKSLELCNSDIVQQFPVIRNQMRAGAIQAFGFTYELCVGMLKRYLREISANPQEIDRMSFRDLIRQAIGQGLLCSELDVWMQYRDSCNTTSYVYNEQRAQNIFQNIPAFLKDARYLLAQLQGRSWHSCKRGADILTNRVDIRPDHLEIVQGILRKHLPEDVKVWVFGSRAHGTTRDSSDLDLALP